MAYIDLSVFNQAIDAQGEEVDIEVYSTQSYSDYGDLMSQTTTSYTCNAIFNDYGTMLQFNPEGAFSQNRFSFFFKGSQPGIATKNIIVRSNGERWRILKPSNHTTRGNLVVQEAPVSNA